MRRRRGPLIVGIFAVAGAALAVALVLAVGSGRVFGDETRAVALFDESVNGLEVGANVKFRGIPVGRVAAMRIDWSRLDAGGADVPIEVTLELEKAWAGQGRSVEALVGRGLRAQLARESLITNVRYVSLALRPDAAPTRRASSTHAPEIPTVRASVAVLQDRTSALLAELTKVDYEALAEAIRRLANQVSGFVSDPLDLGEIAEQRGALVRQLQGVLEEVERAAESVRRLADQISRDPGSLIRGGRQ